eukprot:58240_1
MGICDMQTRSDSVDGPITNVNNGIWQFKGDNVGWISMSQQDSDNIFAACQSIESNGKKYQYKRRKYLYEIDFTKMTQTNKQTNKSRPIRYHIPPQQHVPANGDFDDDKNESEALVKHTDDGYQWQCWLSDKNTWCNYDLAINDQLECCYESEQNACAIEINNNKYQVDLDKMVQMNVDTSAQRKIRRTCTKDTEINDTFTLHDLHQWQCWLSDKRVWCDYNTEHNAQLERWHQSHQSICNLTINGNQYKINLEEMTQLNITTNVSRNIKRISILIKRTNFIWQWKDNDNKYKLYPQDISDRLEAIYINKGSNTSVVKIFGSQYYEIKPLQFKQINKATQFTRAMRRVHVNEADNEDDTDEGIGLWQWKDDGEIWKNYDPKTNKCIESRYKIRDEKVVINIGPKRTKYVIVFEDLTQINIQTKNKRHVRRIEVNAEDDRMYILKEGQRDDVNLWKGPLRKTHGKEIKRLYHITGAQAAQAINKSKRMIRGKDGMFGGGIYFAESKEDAQHKSENKGGWLITAKVFTGEAMVLNHGNAGKYDFNSLSAKGFDSIYAPKGGGKGKPEWCVYNWDQVLVVKVAEK